MSNAAEGISVEATNGTASVSGVVAENITDGAAVDVTGKDVTVKDTEVSNAQTGVNINATENAEVSNVGVSNTTDKGVSVEAETAKISEVTANGGNGTALDVQTTGDAEISNVNMNDFNGTGVKVVSEEGNVDIGDVSANGGNGTAVDVQATNGNATVKDVSLTNYTGESAVVNATGGEVDNINVTGGNVTKPVTSENITGDSRLNYDADKAFNIPESTSKTQTYSIEMPADATGKFTVSVDGKEVGSADLVNGKASVSVSLGAGATHDVVLSYSGDATYKPISKSAKVTIPADPVIPTVTKKKVTIKAKSVKKSYKRNAKVKKIKITLKSGKKALKGKYKITLKVNKKLKGKYGKKLKKGKVFTVKFNKKGIGYIKLTKSKVKGFKKGSYKFTVTFKGNKNYKAATKKNIKMKIK